MKTKKLILISLASLGENSAKANKKKFDVIKTLVIALLVGLLAFNANPSKATITLRKIDGYQEAKWGMLPEEVKEAFSAQHFPPRLERVRYFSSEYPGELLTEDLVSTFSFGDTILGNHTIFNFHFYRNKLYKVQLRLSRPLGYEYFKWFWEAIEQKYRPAEGYREIPRTIISLKVDSWSWKDTEGNEIHLFWKNAERLYVISYINTFMNKKLDGELEKLEEEKARKRRRELEDIF